MNDSLLIGIKDGKVTVLAQGGEENLVRLAKKFQIKDNPSYDSFIVVQGFIVNTK